MSMIISFPKKLIADFVLIIYRNNLIISSIIVTNTRKGHKLGVVGLILIL